MKGERLVILSGPSGIGKGPIVEWTKKILPELVEAYVYKSRTPRHDVDPNYGLPKHIGLPETIYCRGSRQEIYLDSIKDALDKNQYVLIETYYKAHDMLKSEFGFKTDVKSVFITPMSSYHTDYLKKYSAHGLDMNVRDKMMNSLVRRAIDKKQNLTKELIDDLEMRAEDAIHEMQFAENYDLILENEEHEYKSGWKEKKLSGKYLEIVDSLCDIIKTGDCRYARPGKNYRI